MGNILLAENVSVALQWPLIKEFLYSWGREFFFSSTSCFRDWINTMGWPWTLHYLGIVTPQWNITDPMGCIRDCGTDTPDSSASDTKRICELWLHQIRLVSADLCGCVCSPLPIAPGFGYISSARLHGDTVSYIICTSWGQFQLQAR